MRRAVLVMAIAAGFCCAEEVAAPQDFVSAMLRGIREAKSIEDLRRFASAKNTADTLTRLNEIRLSMQMYESRPLDELSPPLLFPTVLSESESERTVLLHLRRVGGMGIGLSLGSWNVTLVREEGSWRFLSVSKVVEKEPPYPPALIVKDAQ